MIYDKSNNNDNNNNKNNNKPIDVNANVTPISNQPVGVISSHLWRSKDVSSEFLNDQLNIMNDRLIAAMGMNNQQMLQYIQSGINELNSVIMQRLASKDN